MHCHRGRSKPPIQPQGFHQICMRKMAQKSSAQGLKNCGDPLPKLAIDEIASRLLNLLAIILSFHTPILCCCPTLHNTHLTSVWYYPPPNLTLRTWFHGCLEKRSFQHYWSYNTRPVLFIPLDDHFLPQLPPPSPGFRNQPNCQRPQRPTGGAFRPSLVSLQVSVLRPGISCPQHLWTPHGLMEKDGWIGMGSLWKRGKSRNGKIPKD